MALIPMLRVQRMGKRFRIVYEESRCLAKFNSGEPCDGGGYLDEYKDGEKVVDGQVECLQKLVLVTDGQEMQDPEAEAIGN